jgi:hypothetical protein
MRLILLALSSLLAWPVQAAPPELLASLDALYARRADTSASKELEATLKKELQAAPDDYELIWRSARLLAWQGDVAQDNRLKKVLGKQAWDRCEQGVKLAPERVECQYFAAVGIGAYSQAVGIVKALGEGLEGKFNERLDAAIRMDPDFDFGAPVVIKGRYHFELPWPKRNLGESTKLLERVVAKFPQNLRAHAYLAETLLKDGKPAKAKEAILKVKQGSGAYNPAEAQLIQERSKKLEAEIEEELK